MSANPAHAAMYSNYRRLFIDTTKQVWPGTDDELEAIIDRARGFDTPDRDAVIIEDMKELLS